MRVGRFKITEIYRNWQNLEFMMLVHVLCLPKAIKYDYLYALPFLNWLPAFPPLGKTMNMLMDFLKIHRNIKIFSVYVRQISSNVLVLLIFGTDFQNTCQTADQSECPQNKSPMTSSVYGLIIRLSTHP